MANPQHDIPVADAMNRVLDVEREAADAIRDAQAEAENLLRVARETRRRILDRARDRASRLHVRAQAQLTETLARLEAASGSPGGPGDSPDTVAARAIENLARRLIATDHESP